MHLHILFSGIGALVAVIYVIDGWKSPSEGVGVLAKSRKMRGLMLILGTLILPTLLGLLKNLTTSMPVDSSQIISTSIFFYAISAVLSILFLLFLLGGFTFLVSYNRLHDVKPNRSRIKIAVDALSFSALAIYKDYQTFNEELDKVSGLCNKLIHQRDKTTEFLTGTFNALVENNLNHRSGIDAFRTFTVNYLQLFVQFFLEPSKALDNYRASVYFADRSSSFKQQQKLLFFAGVSPQSLPYSARPLTITQSFAGWVIDRPDKVFIFIRNEANFYQGGVIPFEYRQPHGQYNLIAACAVSPLHRNSFTIPSLVICIDCKNHAGSMLVQSSEDYKYIEKMILHLSYIIATAQASMGVSYDDIRNWIYARDLRSPNH